MTIDTSNLNNSIKQRFIKDFKLPITIFDEPYFSYFVELYNPLFNIDEKLNYLNNVLKNCNVTDDFFNKSSSLASNIKKYIEDTKSYKLLNSQDFDMNIKFPLENIVSQQNIYIDQNIDKELISIDLDKANFNCLKLVGLHDEINCNNYKDLVSKFTSEKYYLESKMIRQVIFGDLNPKRQQRLQKFIIQEICKELIKNGLELSSASSDEVIIKTQTNVNHVKEILKDIREKYDFFRIESFSFSKVHPDHNFFIKKTIKENGDESLEFKNTPNHVFPQVYKQYFKKELNEYDMLFYFEGYMAQFKTPVFSNELTLEKKKLIK